jgi:hypothetical protein
MKIHVCGSCEHVCTGDGTDEHMCGNKDCLSLHLPSPQALDRQARERQAAR